MSTFRLLLPVVAFLICHLLSAPLSGQEQSVSIQNLLNEADELFAASKLDSAKEVYKAALKLDEESLGALAGLGRIAASEEDWGDVKGRFGKILELDPDNQEANYYRGIAYRETGKFKVLLLRKLDWDKSKKHFQRVISLDSLYQDVLYQYARLLRYREKYEEAIQIGHTQVRLRPDLVEPQVKLFRLYRYFITHKSRDDALAWLKEQPWDHASYFIGEKLRRDRKLEQADSVFRSLLDRPIVMSLQPIYLSLARLYYEQDETTKAEEYYWRAIDEIRNHVDADLVFEDLKYLLKDKELEIYRSLDSVQAKVHFFRSFWILRDPTPAAEHSVRLAEHYRRLVYAEKYFEYDGFRGWFASPDPLSRLEYPEVVTLNHEFNDKGLIYIRHGEPDEKVLTSGADVPFNESWLYYETQATPRLTFHFIIGKSGNDWRFAPIITNRDMLEDRLTWGNIYFRLLRADDLDRLQYEEEMAEESRQSVATGLATDRHTWKESVKPLDMPFSFATFRGKHGQTVLELYYAIPLSQLARGIGKDDEEVEVERGVALYDQNLSEVARKHETTPLEVHKSDAYVGLYQFTLYPDTYNVALYARPHGVDLLGGYKVQKTVDDYRAQILSMSDVELASQIEPSVEETKFDKNGLLVVPNPSQVVTQENPLYIYFEIYNLTEDSEGLTNFKVEYTLSALKGKRKGITTLFGLLGGGEKSSVAIRTDREGDDEFSAEYTSIDVSAVEPGEYDLIVRVTDNHTGNVTERTKRITVI